MKIKQVSEHIWSLQTWMVFPMRVWVVVEEDGVTLVDTGISTMVGGIMKFIEQLHVGPLRRILLTHGHADHTGGVRKIRKVHHVPVYVHSQEIPYMEGDVPYPRRKKAVASVPKGIVEALSMNHGGEGIDAIGSLIPYHTPGHSPGHVVYYHVTDQVLLAGDLFTSKKGRLYRPMPIFTADMQEALQSSAIVHHLKPKKLEVAHGNPVPQPADQWEAYMTETRAAFPVRS